MTGYDPDEKLRAYGMPVKSRMDTAVRMIPIGAAPSDPEQRLYEPLEDIVTDKKYVTAQEIVIPAGTEVQLAPNKISRYVPYAGVLLGVTKDTTAEWTMPLDEALETGLIKEITE